MEVGQPRWEPKVGFSEALSAGGGIADSVLVEVPTSDQNHFERVTRHRRVTSNAKTGDREIEPGRGHRARAHS